MRQILTVTKGNIKKNKSVYFSVFILLVLVCVSLYSILSYYDNSRKRDLEVLEQNGFGDMLAAVNNETMLSFYQTDVDTIINNMEKSKAVDHVNKSKTIYADMIDCNGKKRNGTCTCFIVSENDPYLCYTQYDENNKEINKKLKKGQISVPVSYRQLYGCKIGDTVTLGSDDVNREYEVVSFFEDPFMGSAVMGIKTLLICDEDINELEMLAKDFEPVILNELENPENKSKEVVAFQKSYVLNVFQAEDSELTPMRFEKELNHVSDMASFCWISISKTVSSEYMMAIINIFALLLFVFALILFVAALTILSHNISTSIELDFCNIGILKAVGMTNGAIKVSLLLGYLLAAAAAMIVSVPLSIPLLKVITSVTRGATGLYIPAALNSGIVACVIAIMFIFIIIFVLIKTIKLSEITPLRAICDGNKSVYFSSYLKLQIRKKTLSLSLAYRQFISGKKQYISVMIVTAVLALCMIIMNQICNWVNNPKVVNQIFEISDSDLIASYENEDVAEYAEKIIRKYTGFQKYHQRSEYMLLNDMQLYAYIIDDAEYIQSIMEGRTCKYANEIIVAKQLAKDFDLKIGDEVTVKQNGKKGKFIISGIYSCGNDMGKNFIMNFDGYQTLFPDAKLTNNWGTSYYQLEDDSEIDKIIDEIKSKYKENEQFSMAASYDAQNSGLEVIVIGIQGMTVLVYFLGAVFMIVTVGIVCNKMIAKEKRDYGIFKSIGFTSINIRLLLALRFAIASFIGAMMGVGLYIVLNRSIYDVVFGYFGIYNCKAATSFSVMAVPVVFMVVIFTLFAFIMARKVSRTDVKMLVAE